MPLFHDAHRAQLLHKNPDKPYIVMRLCETTGKARYWGTLRAFKGWHDLPENAQHYKDLRHAKNRAGADGYVIDLRERFDLNAEQKERDAAAVESLKRIS